MRDKSESVLTKKQVTLVTHKKRDSMPTRVKHDTERITVRMKRRKEGRKE